MVCPDGKENLSGGKTFDQQCGSIWQGRCRWLNRFNNLKTATPKSAAHAEHLPPHTVAARQISGTESPANTTTTIAQPGGRNHPVAYPARRPPPVHPPHQPVIAALNITPNLACDGHGFNSRAAPESSSLGSRL